MSKSKIDQYIIPTYARFDVEFVSGEGRYLFDSNNKKYVDLGGGIAVNCLGHANPELAEVIYQQAKTLTHTSNLYYSKPAGELAEQICKLMVDPGKLFFCNSGAEANEGLYKLARKFGKGRYEIITALNSFHGRTLGGIAATGQDKIKAGFEPFCPGFKHVPYNDLEAMKSAITDKTVAILIEGIQGEGGIIPATTEYLLGLRKLCDEHNLLLMIDAVQCGHFRTGRYQSYQKILGDLSFRPDAVSMAKSIGGGLPLGAFWVSEPHQDTLTAGSHGTTYGGNLIACAAASKIIEIIERDNLVDNINRQSKYLVTQLERMISKFPALKEVKGLGLILGLQVNDNLAWLSSDKPYPAQICSDLLEKGLILIPSGNNTLRFLPAYNVTSSEIDEAVEIMEAYFGSHS